MVPVDIVCGLLGAGKTTLIRRMLETTYAGERIAIIENEVGAVNFDADAFEAVSITQLTSGCVCCTLQGDLARALDEIAGGMAVDRIVIEPSGVADVAGLLQTCRRSGMVSPGRVIMVVHSPKFLSLQKVAGSFLQEMIKASQYVYLNFADRLPEQELEQVRQAIRSCRCDIRFLETIEDLLLLELRQFPDTLSGEAYLGSVDEGTAGRRSLSRYLRTASPYWPRTVQFAQPLSEAQLSSLLALVQKYHMIRVKGIISLDETAVKLDICYGEVFKEIADSRQQDKLGYVTFISRQEDPDAFLKELQEISPLSLSSIRF